MKKTWFSAISLALAAAAALSLPAFAAELVTEDDFSDSATVEEEWVVDNYEPEDFYVQGGVAYLAVGDNGYARNRPEDKRDKSYNLQGYKLKSGRVSALSWTASVRLEVDDTWYGVRTDSYIKERAPKVSSQSILDNKKKVTFRVDLTGKNATPPAITFVKGGDGAPTIKYYDPEEPQGWGTADFDWEAANAASSKSAKSKSAAQAAPTGEEAWHTLTVTFNNGLVTYYIDAQRIGDFEYASEKAQPSYLALSMQNFQRPDVSAWDDVRLYDGVQVPKK